MKTKCNWLCYCGASLYIISLIGGLRMSYGDDATGFAGQSVAVGFCICGILLIFGWYNMNRFNELKELIGELKNENDKN